jgi:hypothetical protein
MVAKAAGFSKPTASDHAQASEEKGLVCSGPHGRTSQAVLSVDKIEGGR